MAPTQFPKKEDYDELIRDWYAVALQARRLEKRISERRKALTHSREAGLNTRTLKEEVVNLRTELTSLWQKERLASRKVLVFLIVQHTIRN